MYLDVSNSKTFKNSIKGNDPENFIARECLFSNLSMASLRRTLPIILLLYLEAGTTQVLRLE